MDGSERDSTHDWLVPAAAAPPLLSELELRIDEALVIARASEEAVREVGDAAIDAAKQARRAAELAERASVAALDASRSGGSMPPPEGGAGSTPLVDVGLRSFSERADRVVARLRALQRRPPPSGAASAVAGRRRSRG
jgi:hypothetical protein